MSTKPSVRVALPWLHDAIVEAHASSPLPPLPSFAWLAGRGVRKPPVSPHDWRHWLLAAVDEVVPALLQGWPAGPSLAAATSGARVSSSDGDRAHCWAVAQPVHFAAGMDHVRLAPLADAVPTATEAAQLAATLNAHFADDVLEFGEFRDGAWLVRCRTTLECTTHDPATAAGRNIHDYLPAGTDGARVRSLMNEIQMLLHEHPVNQRRAARRALPVNGLWLWGFGPVDAADVTQPPGLARWTLYADDLWLRSFWQMHGGVVRGVGEAVTGTTAASSITRTQPSATRGAPIVMPQTATFDALIALTQPPTTDAAEALIEVDSSLLARLRRGVRSGELQSLEVFDGARVYEFDALSRWRFWRRPVTPGELLP